MGAQPFAIVKVLVVNDAGEMLALKRDPNDVNRPGEWDFPGGNVDPGEDLIQAALRETQEEAGLDFALDDLKLVYGATGTNPKGSITWLFFRTFVKGRPAVKISHEHTEYTWLAVPVFLERCVHERHKQALNYLLEQHLLDA
ncbi:MAG TPA: NUDIX hydrolase [Candidatus Saccharimonadales bacterium]|nr:NUDIX hydrolase [Candidatus Saccharimonadales bacterium]